MDQTTKLIRRNDLLTADMNGSAVTMDMQSGKYYNMGETGGNIWNKLETEKTISQLADELVAEYGITKDQCLTDIMPFLNKLVEKGLLLICQ